MLPIGANTWIWVSPLTDERLAALAPKLRDWGFDVIELPIENPGDWDPRRSAELLDSLGLGATACIVMPAERDLTTEDDLVAEATKEYVRYCIDAAVTVGARALGGPLYAPVGKTWHLSVEERQAVLARVAERIRPLADYAGERGVRLGIEPLNRFETSVINTVDQALELVELVDSPACGVSLDTFHMNIEEKDPAAAILRAGRHIVHVQVCGNDRGAPGNDHTQWTSIIQALRRAAYRGPLVIESFTAENRTIATAASIWRPLERSQDAIAVDGLAFLRELDGPAA